MQSVYEPSVPYPESQAEMRKLEEKAPRLNRISQLDPTQVMGNTKRLFDQVQANFEVVPNLFRVLGHSPATLEGYLNLSGAPAAGNFEVKVREQIALTVAESNLCGYCLRAHAFSGDKVGLAQKDIADAIHVAATIDKVDATLKLVRGIAVQPGEVRDSDLERARIFGLEGFARSRNTSARFRPFPPRGFPALYRITYTSILP
jgi:AhpD family alkylhydroperoxidase